MSDGFEVISSGLLVTNVGVYTGVSGRTGQILSIQEWNVLTIRALVTLRETEVDNVDGILGVFIASNQKVVRLDISMNDPLFVHNLDSLDHLH